MCGRYAVITTPTALSRLFGASNPSPNFSARYNAAPTQSLPVIRRHPETGARHLDLLRWGLVPVWAKDAGIGARLINARSETVAEKPAFRAAFAKRRCLVPANAFYEWRKDGGTKQPCAIASVDPDGVIAFAGLWEGWRDPASQEWLHSFTILTCAANPDIATIHDRMPVILAPNDWNRWLDNNSTGSDLHSLLVPCPTGWLRHWPIGKAVGNVSNDGPELLAPLAS